MSSCFSCGQLIVFGEKTVAGRTYCSTRCSQADRAGIVAALLPPDELTRAVEATVRGCCPQCGKQDSPVGMWVSHRAVSIVILTYWRSTPMLGCVSCGRAALIQQTLVTLLFGWWGFPFGLIATPIQVARNLAGMLTTGDTNVGSPALRELVGRRMAEGPSLSSVVPAPLAALSTEETTAARWGRQVRSWLRSRKQEQHPTSAPVFVSSVSPSNPPESAPSPSKRALARCQAHGLAYDSTQHAGCVVCRRS